MVVSNDIKAYDVVILGGGGAGLAAAARIAYYTDKKILVVEKRKAVGGGALHAADFKVYGSKWQRERGIPDNTLSALRGVMNQTWWRLDPKLAYNCFKASGEFFDFLCDTTPGAEDMYVEGTYVFDGPDGPKIPAYKEQRRGGAFAVRCLERVARENGADFLTSCSALDIARETDGFVVSLSNGETVTAKTCILATGSWIRNEEVTKKHLPWFHMQMNDGPHTHPTYTGDGIAMAEKLGAAIDYDSFCVRLMGPLAMAPSQTLMSVIAEPYVLWVNKDGKRWINENAQKKVGIFDTGNLLHDQPGQRSFYVFDDSILEAAAARYREGHREPWRFPVPPSYPEDFRGDIENCFSMPGKNAPGVPPPPFGAEAGKPFARADTLDELAELMGIDAGGLAETVKRYNSLCEKKLDEDFFKEPEELLPLVKPPFYAVRGGLGSDGAFGGVPVNPGIQAYAKDGGLVDGLYVPGDFSSGRFVNVNNNKIQIINDLAWAFSSGWIAAGNVMA